MFNPNNFDNNDNKPNENIPNEKAGATWNGECYHGVTPEAQSTAEQDETSRIPGMEKGPEAPQGNPYAHYNQYSTYSSKPEDPWSSQYHPYGETPDAKTTPKKEKKHTVRNIFIGALACLVVSAGSIAGFVALVNNGTVKLQSGSTSSTPAFTIVENSSSKNTASTTNANTTTSELTKQEVAKKILPSVVCIENYSSTSTLRYSNQYGFGDDEGNNGGNNNGNNGNTTNDTTDNEVSPSSEGSGIIATKDGYIITNAHVVSGASKLKVVLYNGKTYAATIVGSDSITDLALIKIDATGLTAAEFGSSQDLQIADAVMAIGNPGGLEFNSSVTVGYVSALNREITNSESGLTMKCIQTDAAINPGNSGGALVNMKGQVIGINSSKIVATGYEGLGFAIPINTAQPVISELKQYGYVKDRAVLGVSGQYIDSMTARFYGLSTGYFVSSVTSEYVTSAGIQKGDVITKIDGKTVASLNMLAGVIAEKKPGETVTLTVVRASTGKTFTASVKLSQATGKS